jgi:hypothetical protein
MPARPLLQPDNHALLLIDHPYLQLITARSHDSEKVVAATVLLAKGAKLLKVPTLLTTDLRKIQGLVHEVQAVFPEQGPIDRTNLNAFEDPRIVEWVRSLLWLACGPRAASKCRLYRPCRLVMRSTSQRKLKRAEVSSPIPRRCTA